MTKPLALMDMNVYLPASCSFEFHCHKNNNQSRMEEVAAFIEGLSSECLTKHEENKIHAQLRSKEPLSAPIHPECRIVLDYTQENYFSRMREAAALVSDI